MAGNVAVLPPGRVVRVSPADHARIVEGDRAWETWAAAEMHRLRIDRLDFIADATLPSAKARLASETP